MTFGVCNIPEAGVAHAPGAVPKTSGFGHSSSEPVPLKWLLGTAVAALLLSL